MKKHWPWILTGLLVFEVLFSFRTRTDKEGEFAYRQFGRLPALLGGRLQPLESIARNNLLIIRGTTKVPLEGNGADGAWGKWEELSGDLTERKWHQFSKRPAKLKPAHWLLEVFAKPELADTRYIFRIHHPDLLGELDLNDSGVDKSGLRFYSFAQLEPHLGTIEAASRTIFEVKAERRTPYQKAVVELRHALQLYIRLKNSVRPQMVVDDEALMFEAPTPELAVAMGLPQREPANYSYQEIQPKFDAVVDHVRTAMREDESSWRTYANFFGKYQAYESLRSIWRDEWKDSFQAELRDYEAALKDNDSERLASFWSRYDHMQELAYPHLVRPADPNDQEQDWENMGAALSGKRGDRIREIPSTVFSYASMVSAYREGNVSDFNRHLAEYEGAIRTDMPIAIKKAGVESVFNQFAPFQRAMMIYLLGFILTLVFWLRLSENWRRAGFQLIVLGVVVHTCGLMFRMYIGGYAPVTNLYSSAIFVGWAAVLLGIVLEMIFRNGIGIVTSSGIGYITLIIAHHLAMEGDTMEMMRAVLDTNFWLATHVTIITIGYAATFLAGFLGIAYIIGGLFTPAMDNEVSKILSRMVYGIVCFATLFSFVGTVLGGLWADYSWGRFWGWDPKENGALLIVIWNATILHLRWGGMIRERGLMNCAVFGNIVTAFSWFGVNMLGIGLHSYGFMDAAFKWLSIFSVSQLALIVFGSLPFAWWWSVRSGKLAPAGYKPAA